MVSRESVQALSEPSRHVLRFGTTGVIGRKAMKRIRAALIDCRQGEPRHWRSCRMDSVLSVFSHVVCIWAAR
ncbi:hypothetical protein SISSUDRAFT_878656 [Sistotremastrum suecicum HHB10207 ss-3]|uniref:Uncharacterized protein n=1 Tax=Sistotremastrum suecicum HHB10207 ss-3 TaxID=1314776 RepID=A0A166C8T6_9AGAM|nr:hypothetical protein SISSUDRAFT_878656 [Sistotremastrum suecicum HHB10207 ss-3]